MLVELTSTGLRIRDEAGRLGPEPFDPRMALWVHGHGPVPRYRAAGATCRCPAAHVSVISHASGDGLLQAPGRSHGPGRRFFMRRRSKSRPLPAHAVPHSTGTPSATSVTPEISVVVSMWPVALPLRTTSN